MKIFVTLLDSHNVFLAYPVSGVLEVLETGTDGSIIQAVFRVAKGINLDAPVVVRHPQFKYDIFDIPRPAPRV